MEKEFFVAPRPVLSVVRVPPPRLKRGCRYGSADWPFFGRVHRAALQYAGEQLAGVIGEAIPELGLAEVVAAFGGGGCRRPSIRSGAKRMLRRAAEQCTRARSGQDAVDGVLALWEARCGKKRS